MSSKIILRRVAQALALTGLAVTLPACATITRGTTQQFTIESSPPNALATTSNGFRCESTPCTLRMPRKDGFTVTVSKQGFVSQTRTVDSSVSGGGGTAMAGNILVGGLIGMGVDATSGAMNDLTPNPMVITLEREVSVVAQGGATND